MSTCVVADLVFSKACLTSFLAVESSSGAGVGRGEGGDR